MARVLSFIRPDGWPKTFKRESKSQPGELHTVTIINPDGYGTCDCKGFGYRMTCSHYKDVLKELGITPGELSPVQLLLATSRRLLDVFNGAEGESDKAKLAPHMQNLRAAADKVEQELAEQAGSLKEYAEEDKALSELEHGLVYQSPGVLPKPDRASKFDIRSIIR